MKNQKKEIATNDKKPTGEEMAKTILKLLEFQEQIKIEYILKKA